MLRTHLKPQSLAYTSSRTAFSTTRALNNTASLETCTKYHPARESAKTLRHLRFTIPYDYNDAHKIQTEFVSAFVSFKEMISKINRSNEKLAKEGLESNDYEKKIVQSIIDNKPSPTILSFEFKPVISAGRREKSRLNPEDITKLKSTGYDFVQADRGGQISFHNPGQLVVYPIIDLKDFQGLKLKCFVSLLEDSVINMLRKHGIKAKKTENTGVWVGDDTKIASIGLQVRRAITFHGLSLNVRNEIPKIEEVGMSFCGLPEKTQTTMKNLGVNISVADASREFVRELAAKLGVQNVETMELDSLELHTDDPDSVQ